MILSRRVLCQDTGPAKCVQIIRQVQLNLNKKKSLKLNICLKPSDVYIFHRYIVLDRTNVCHSFTSSFKIYLYMLFKVTLTPLQFHIFREEEM